MGNEVRILNSSGWLLKKYTSSRQIKSLVIGDSIAGVVYKNRIEDPLKALYWKFTIDFGVMYEKMLKEWSEHCVKELEGIKHEYFAD